MGGMRVLANARRVEMEFSIIMRAMAEPQPGDRVQEERTGFTYEVVGVAISIESGDRVVIYRYRPGVNLFSCGLGRWLEAIEDGAMTLQTSDAGAR